MPIRDVITAEEVAAARQGKLAKPEPRQRVKARQQRQQAAQVRAIRVEVFAREMGMCRCCGWRAAESMHELRFKSLGGTASRENSVAVCGDGTRGCHGFLQRLEITYRFDRRRSAQCWIAFKACTRAAADYTGISHSCERASDASAYPDRLSVPPARTVMDRLVDDACRSTKAQL